MVKCPHTACTSTSTTGDQLVMMAASAWWHGDLRHCCSHTEDGVITASTAFHFHSVTQPGEDLGIKSQASLHGDRNVVTEQIYLHGSALWLVRGAQVVPSTGSHWLGGSRDWDQWRCWAGISSEKYESQAAAPSWAGAAPGAEWPGPGPLRASPPMWSHYWNTIPSTMQTGLKCNKYTLYRRHDFSSGLFMSKQIRFTCVHKFTF